MVNKVTRLDLVDIMTDGRQSAIKYIEPELTTDGLFDQVLRTLTFEPDFSGFNYSIENIRQVNYDTLELDFNVDYIFNAFNSSWTITHKPFIVIINVYALWHPLYGEVIDNSWAMNDTGCYVNEIIFDSRWHFFLSGSIVCMILFLMPEGSTASLSECDAR